jgi:hypothetical protein
MKLFDPILERIKAAPGVTYHHHTRGRNWEWAKVVFSVADVPALVAMTRAVEGANVETGYYTYGDAIRYWVRVTPENEDIFLHFLGGKVEGWE